MRGRRNPDKPQSSAMLPPCKVCGEKGSGFHYGVTTCGACKGFFRRSLVRGEPYECLKAPMCRVGPSTSRRQTCPKCRYAKCLAVGMSKDACKVGRYSLVKKSKDIAELLQQQLCRGDNHDDSSDSSDTPDTTTASVTPGKQCGEPRSPMDASPHAPKGQLYPFDSTSSSSPESLAVVDPFSFSSTSSSNSFSSSPSSSSASFIHNMHTMDHQAMDYKSKVDVLQEASLAKFKEADSAMDQTLANAFSNDSTWYEACEYPPSQLYSNWQPPNFDSSFGLNSPEKRMNFANTGSGVCGDVSTQSCAEMLDAKPLSLFASPPPSPPLTAIPEATTSTLTTEAGKFSQGLTSEDKTRSSYPRGREHLTCTRPDFLVDSWSASPMTSPPLVDTPLTPPSAINIPASLPEKRTIYRGTQDPPSSEWSRMGDGHRYNAMPQDVRPRPAFSNATDNTYDMTSISFQNHDPNNQQHHHRRQNRQPNQLHQYGPHQRQRNQSHTSFGGLPNEGSRILNSSNIPNEGRHTSNPSPIFTHVTAPFDNSAMASISGSKRPSQNTLDTHKDSRKRAATPTAMTTTPKKEQLLFSSPCRYGTPTPKPVPAMTPAKSYSIDELVAQSIHTDAWHEPAWFVNLDQQATPLASSQGVLLGQQAMPLASSQGDLLGQQATPLASSQGVLLGQQATPLASSQGVLLGQQAMPLASSQGVLLGQEATHFASSEGVQLGGQGAPLLPGEGVPLGQQAKPLPPSEGVPFGQKATPLSPGEGVPYGQQATPLPPSEGVLFGQQATPLSPGEGVPYGQQATPLPPSEGILFGQQATLLSPCEGVPFGQQATPLSPNEGIPFGQQGTPLSLCEGVPFGQQSTPFPPSEGVPFGQQSTPFSPSEGVPFGQQATPFTPSEGVGLGQNFSDELTLTQSQSELSHIQQSEIDGGMLKQSGNGRDILVHPATEDANMGQSSTSDEFIIGHSGSEGGGTGQVSRKGINPVKSVPEDVIMERYVSEGSVLVRSSNVDVSLGEHAGGTTARCDSANVDVSQGEHAGGTTVRCVSANVDDRLAEYAGENTILCRSAKERAKSQRPSSSSPTSSTLVPNVELALDEIVRPSTCSPTQGSKVTSPATPLSALNSPRINGSSCTVRTDEANSSSNNISVKEFESEQFSILNNSNDEDEEQTSSKMTSSNVGAVKSPQHQGLALVRSKSRSQVDRPTGEESFCLSPTSGATPSSFFLLFVCPELAPYNLAMFEKFPFLSYEQHCLRPLLNSCVDTGEVFRSGFGFNFGMGSDTTYDLNFDVGSDTTSGWNSPKTLAQVPDTPGCTQGVVGEIGVVGGLGTRSSRQTSALGKILDVEIKLQSSFSDQDVEATLSSLMAAHEKNVGFETNSMTEVEIRAAVDIYKGLCKLRDRLHGPIQFVERTAYRQILATTGLDVDKRREYFGLYTTVFNHNLPKALGFFRGVPGFQGFSVEDRMTLVKGSLYEYYILSTYRGYDHQSQIFINLECTLAVRLHVLEKLFPEMSLPRQHAARLYLRLQALNLTQEEIVLMKAICLTRPNRIAQLQDSMLAERLHQKFHRCLMVYLERTRADPDGRYAELKRALREVAVLGALGRRVTRDNQEHYLMLLNHMPVPLCAEAWFDAEVPGAAAPSPGASREGVEDTGGDVIAEKAVAVVS